MLISHYTPEQRLLFYKQALKDYLKPGIDNWRPFGLCLYFTSILEIKGIYYNMSKIFPELCEASGMDESDDRGYWYPSGVKAPRIKCLKLAIKITKERFNIK